MKRKNKEQTPWEKCKHDWHIFSMKKWDDKTKAHMLCNKCGILKTKVDDIHKFAKIEGFASAKDRMPKEY